MPSLDQRYARPQFAAAAAPIGPSASEKAEYASDVAAYGTEFARKKQQMKKDFKAGKHIFKDTAAVSAPRAAAPTFTREDVEFIQEELEDRRKIFDQYQALGRLDTKEGQAVKAELAQKTRMLVVMQKERAAAGSG